MKRIIYTLNVGMTYSPEICAITYPLLKSYAHKIGADFEIITEPYDLGIDGCRISGKFNLFELADKPDTWTIFLDSDALVHPDAIDYTQCLDPVDKHRRPSVFSYGHDFAYQRFHAGKLRWRSNTIPDEAQTSDQALGLCTWFIAVNDQSRCLWVPPTQTFAREIIDYITPTASERHIKTPVSLIDDYMTSYNAASFNLSVNFANDIHALARDTPMGRQMCFWHHHLLSEAQKIRAMHWVTHKVWRLHDTPAMVYARMDRELDKLMADWDAANPEPAPAAEAAPRPKIGDPLKPIDPEPFQTE